MRHQKAGRKIVMLLIIAAAFVSGGCTAMVVNGEAQESALFTPSSESVTADIRAWGQQDPEALRARIFPAQQVTAPAVPVGLAIPALEVDARVEAVGRTATGEMGIPSRAERTAWYQLGAVPGQEGTSVIAGHINTAKDGPGVFANLGDLRPGDQVQVTDSDGITHTFDVQRVERYPYDDAPLGEIFGFQPGAHLNLITCTGSWIKDARSYTERLVVYTTLADPQI